jgi:hypothetical protein
MSLSKEKLLADIKKIDKKFQTDTKSKRGTVTRDFYRKNSKHGENYTKYWGSFKTFRKEAFGDITEQRFNREAIQRAIKTPVSKQKRYILTAAVLGQSLNRPSFESVLNYHNQRDAELVILPTVGNNKEDVEYAEELKDYIPHFAEEYTFNERIKALDLLIKPQQINPLTGIPRLGHKHSSIVVASPKQQMVVVPTTGTSHPHMLHSTGVITNPDTYRYSRQGVLARQDHVIGGLIIETDGPKMFHLRQFQMDKDGSFCDLGFIYKRDKIEPITATAFVLGDYHAGWHVETVVKSWMEICKIIKPKYVLIHDLFDGCSISHHHQHDIKAQIKRPAHLSTIERELQTVGQELIRWHKAFPDVQLVVVRSNHDEHLDRYLKEGRYVDDRMNHRLALDLACYYLDGYNPIEVWLSKNMGINWVKWLKRNDSFKQHGIELGCHGDKGNNGTRGSAQSAEISFGKSIRGHEHTPGILRETMTVGTTADLHPDFTMGSPSSWLNTSAILYPTGQRTLITCIHGRTALEVPPGTA